jgi:hypothetical protein
MKSVLLRVDRLLDREEVVARRHLGAYDGGQIPFESFPSNPMHTLIRWLPLRTGAGRPMVDPNTDELTGQRHSDPDGLEEEDAYEAWQALREDVESGAWRSMLDEMDTHNLLEITAYGGMTLHRTWFVSKQSVQRFLDVLSAHVKPTTSAEAFAELVAALIQMQGVNSSNIVTIVEEVWRMDGRRRLKPLRQCFSRIISPTHHPR